MGAGRQAAAGTGNSDDQERCYLLSGLPFACPSFLSLLLPGALTPEQAKIHRNHHRFPRQGGGVGVQQRIQRVPARALEQQTVIWATYLSSFMAISRGSVSPSSSTITGAHILWAQGQVLGRRPTQGERSNRKLGMGVGLSSQTGLDGHPRPHLERSPLPFF